VILVSVPIYRYGNNRILSDIATKYLVFLLPERKYRVDRSDKIFKQTAYYYGFFVKPEIGNLSTSAQIAVLPYNTVANIAQMRDFGA
jgi:hypothetical protein